MNTKYIILAILISAVITFALRAVPFVIFNGKKKLPPRIESLGKILPSAIMAVLIVYCFKGVVSEPVHEGIPALIAAAVVFATYKWKHNTLISILGGTICYMLLIKFI